MLKSLREDPGHKTSRLTYMSLDLMLHWIYCNIYIQSHKTVKKRLKNFTRNINLQRLTLKKRGQACWNRLDKFVKECTTDLSDIKGSPERIKE